MALNGKAHQKMYFSIPLKKRTATWSEQDRTLPQHTHYRWEREQRWEPGKAPGRTFSIEHHRGPSGWPLCWAFFWGAGMWMLLSVIVTPCLSSCLVWVQRGQNGKGKGDRRWAGEGMLSVVQRHSSAHSSRCSENTGMEGKEQCEVRQAERDNWLLFTKHKDEMLPRFWAGSFLNSMLSSKLRNHGTGGFPVRICGLILCQVLR